LCLGLLIEKGRDGHCPLRARDGILFVPVGEQHDRHAGLLHLGERIPLVAHAEVEDDIGLERDEPFDIGHPVLCSLHHLACIDAGAERRTVYVIGIVDTDDSVELADRFERRDIGGRIEHDALHGNLDEKVGLDSGRCLRAAWVEHIGSARVCTGPELRNRQNLIVVLLLDPKIRLLRRDYRN